MNQNSSQSVVNNTISNTITNTITINTNQLSTSMMSDGMSEPSSPDSTFDTSDLMGAGGIGDDVTSQLVHSGPVGIAAAAAIASGRKKRRPHLFEINPSIRKRQQTRLLRKLKACIEEYTTRIGQQAVVLCCTPCKTSNMNSYKVFGSQPLENVIKSCKDLIMAELETALAEQAPPNTDTQGLYDLPPLTLDGIPTPIDKMTQAQLRTFIPEMLKYSTGRSKPGWGKHECRPIWWPNDVPWANVRSDVRTEEEKKRVSWTDALRAIVKNCYRHHCREDLLNIFGEEVTSDSGAGSQFTGTMVQTINNPDGTVSIIQIDTGPNSVVTLPDGTQATVVHSVTAMQPDIPSQPDMTGSQSNNGSVQIAPVSIEMTENAGSLASLGGGRIMLSGSDAAQISTDPATGLMTIPASMYQNLLASNNGIEISQSALTQIQQQQILTQQYDQSTQQGTSDQLTQGLQEMQTDLVDHQTLQEIQDPTNQNITVRVVSLEPKTEPS